VALLLIDVINDLAFAGGKTLLKQALPMAKRLAALKKRAAQCGIPSIYVNDNFGRWQSDFPHVLRHCLDAASCGKPLATLLRPAEDDYFVLKPKHSGFYSTTLDLLLQALGVRTLILTGLAGNICVLFTANDAYMREYALVIPADCVASKTARENQSALHLMQTVLKADTRPSTALDIPHLLAPQRP
jgi:nicotinamidase-related amidase